MSLHTSIPPSVASCYHYPSPIRYTPCSTQPPPNTPMTSCPAHVNMALVTSHGKMGSRKCILADALFQSNLNKCIQPRYMKLPHITNIASKTCFKQPIPAKSDGCWLFPGYLQLVMTLSSQHCCFSGALFLYPFLVYSPSLRNKLWFPLSCSFPHFSPVFVLVGHQLPVVEDNFTTTLGQTWPSYALKPKEPRTWLRLFVLHLSSSAPPLYSRAWGLSVVR